MKVFWTQHALGQLTDIYQFILRDSDIYAKRVIDSITEASRKLETFPKLGRIVPEIDRDDVREIITGNFRVIYKLKSDRIDILTIIHSSQNFSEQYLPNI